MQGSKLNTASFTVKSKLQGSKFPGKKRGFYEANESPANYSNHLHYRINVD